MKHCPYLYPVEGLVKDGLTPVPGPALLACNDAKFKDKNWCNIGNSIRARKWRTMKVGRFGIGFQSVHHITGTLNVCTT